MDFPITVRLECTTDYLFSEESGFRQNIFISEIVLYCLDLELLDSGIIPGKSLFLVLHLLLLLTLKFGM